MHLLALLFQSSACPEEPFWCDPACNWPLCGRNIVPSIWAWVCRLHLDLDAQPMANRSSVRSQALTLAAKESLLTSPGTVNGPANYAAFFPATLQDHSLQEDRSNLSLLTRLLCGLMPTRNCFKTALCAPIFCLQRMGAQSAVWGFCPGTAAPGHSLQKSTEEQCIACIILQCMISQSRLAGGCIVDGQVDGPGKLMVLG